MTVTIKYFPTLYIWDRNKVRKWRVQVDGTPNNARYCITFGFIDGAVESKYTEVSGKNVGKSNATTSWEQAMRDAQALYDKKVKEGYKNEDEFDFNNPQDRTYGETDTPKAMLLYKADAPNFIGTGKEKLYPVIFPCYVQEKLDGVFAAATKEHGLITRGGELTLTPKGETLSDIFPEITFNIKELCNDIEKQIKERVVLNGELYVKDSNLQNITSAAKKHNSLSDSIEYHIFDVYLPNKPKANQVERFNILHHIQLLIDTSVYTKINYIPETVAYSWNDISDIEDTVILFGGEGLVLRNKRGVYTPGKRSRDVLKLVRFDQTSVWIEDVIPMEKEPTQGIFVCNYSGKEFKVTPSEFNHDQRNEMLRNKHNYIGKKLLIQHRGYTNDGIPRIAKGVKIINNG